MITPSNEKATPERYSGMPHKLPARKAVALVTQIWPPLMFGVIIVVGYVMLRNSLPPHRQFLLPGASDMWTQALSRPDFLLILGQAALITLTVALVGLSVSILFGLSMGLLMFRYKIAERAVFPYLVILQSVPILAIVPLMQIAFGFGFLPKMLVVVLLTFFALPTTFLVGLRSVDAGLVDLLRVYGASWWTILRKAGLPAAARTLFAGLRIAAALAIIGAIVSELFFLSGPGGLGQLIVNSKLDFKYEQMYAALIVASALSLSVYGLFAAGERILFGSRTSSA